MTDVVDLFAWQVALKFNSTVLNLTELWIPEDNVFANHTYVSPPPAFGVDVVDGLDYVMVGSSLLGSDSVNVSEGVLFKANFTALGNGETPILITTSANPAQISTWQRLFNPNKF